MKKIIKSIGALALGAMVFAMSPLSVLADEKSYTYNYDYWGDVQDSPDAYTVAGVYTAEAFGLDLNLRNPQGMFVKENMVYICDTGNNRIVQLERTGTVNFEVVRIFDSIQGDTDVQSLASPTDIAISEEGDIYICDNGNARIVKVDSDLNYILQFDLPVDSNVSADSTFQRSEEHTSELQSQR